MSFRQFGGLNYAPKHNIVGSNYNTSNNLLITQNVGQPSSYINFVSDISGNVNIHGDFIIDGNIIANDISANDINANDINANDINANDIYAYDIKANDINGNDVNVNDINASNITAYDIKANDINGNDVNVNDINVNTIHGGSATFSGSVSASSFNATSDYRIKENITPLNDTFVVDNLKPITYTNSKTNKTDMGFMAHELQEHFPFLVEGEKNGENLQSINYIGLIALLVKEIQDLKKEIQIIKQQK